MIPLIVGTLDWTLLDMTRHHGYIRLPDGPVRRSAQRGQALRQTFSNLPFLLDEADFGFGEDTAEGGAIIDSTQGVRSRSPIGTLA